ncbi:MAG: ATP-binding protein [Luteibaculaceae bacterium]
MTRETYFGLASSEINIPSTIESLKHIEKFAERIFLEYDLPQELFGKVMVVLLESVNNAVVHGNKSNPELWVKILFVNSDESIRFVVIDEGNGFDYTKIPDPTTPENIEKTSGRGLFLISSLVDEIKFYENGSILDFTFAKFSK